MKRIFLGALLVGMIFCFAGCGSKPSTLDCSMKTSSVEVNLVSNFIGNKINSMSMQYKMDFSSYSDTIVNTLAKKDYCATVKSAMGSQFTLINCTQEIQNKVLVISSGIDITKFKSKDLTGSPAATKTALEKQGYTCTLK